MTEPRSPAERRYAARYCAASPCGSCHDAQARLRCAARRLHDALDAAGAALDT